MRKDYVPLYAEHLRAEKPLRMDQGSRYGRYGWIREAVTFVAAWLNTGMLTRSKRALSASVCVRVRSCARTYPGV